MCVRIWVVRYVEKINRNTRSELSVSLRGVSPAAVTCATKGILWPGRPQQKVTRDANPLGRTQCSQLPAGLLCPQSSATHARSQHPLLRVRKVMLSLEVNFRTFPLPSSLIFTPTTGDRAPADRHRRAGKPCPVHPSRPPQGETWGVTRPPLTQLREAGALGIARVWTTGPTAAFHDRPPPRCPPCPHRRPSPTSLHLSAPHTGHSPLRHRTPDATDLP